MCPSVSWIAFSQLLSNSNQTYLWALGLAGSFENDGSTSITEDGVGDCLFDVVIHGNMNGRELNGNEQCVLPRIGLHEVIRNAVTSASGEILSPSSRSREIRPSVFSGE